MEPIAIALFALCAALIGLFGLVFWGLARMASEELERSREKPSRRPATTERSRRHVMSKRRYSDT